MVVFLHVKMTSAFVIKSCSRLYIYLWMIVIMIEYTTTKQCSLGHEKRGFLSWYRFVYGQNILSPSNAIFYDHCCCYATRFVISNIHLAGDIPLDQHFVLVAINWTNHWLLQWWIQYQTLCCLLYWMKPRRMILFCLDSLIAFKGKVEALRLAKLDSNSVFRAS